VALSAQEIEDQVEIKVGHSLKSFWCEERPTFVNLRMPLPPAAEVNLAILLSLQKLDSALFLLDLIQYPVDEAFHICGSNVRFGTETPPGAITSSRDLRRSHLQESSKLIGVDVVSRNQKHGTSALTAGIVVAIKKHGNLPD